MTAALITSQARDLAFFTEGNRWRDVPAIVDWMLRSLVLMAEGLFDPTQTFKTLEEVKAAFETEVLEAWDEHIWWLDQTKEYFSGMTYREYKAGKDLFDHPWGQDVLKPCRHLLAVEPSVIFTLACEVEEFAADHARDYTLSIITQEDDGNLKGKVEKKFEEVVQALRNKFEEAKA